MFKNKDNFVLIFTISICTLLISGSVLFLGLQIAKTSNGQLAQEPKREDSLSSYLATAKADLENDDAVLGDPEAPITIIEYSDYQCPFCRSHFLNAYQQLKSEYIDKGIAKLIFKDYPLEFHDDAIYVANAGECLREASDDETYFAFHDAVFEFQGPLSNGTVQLSDEDVYDLIKQVGVSKRDVQSCIENKKFYPEIAADVLAANEQWLATNPAPNDGFGTPTFFINGEMIVGAQPFEVFQEKIEAALNN